MSPCIAQAASLIAAAPSDYSLPPALDVKGLQVPLNVHCVLYTFFLNTMSLCVAQAASLIAAAPEDYSPPPALDVKGVQVP